MIKQKRYKDFSLKTHLANAHDNYPSLCQMELTFDCPFNCAYCYNRPLAKNPKPCLKTREIKDLIDDLKRNRVLWLCFTGGDPLARKDFGEIYRYAYNQGFLLTVFTSGFLLNKKFLKLFHDHPPFFIEVTLNAVTKDLYEKISGVKGSFKRVTDNLSCLKQMKVPLRLKTQVTRLNNHELPLIEDYAHSLGAAFRAGFFLHPALDGSFKAVDMRLAPEKEGKNRHRRCENVKMAKGLNHELFNCTAPGGDSFFLDPYGNMFLCNSLQSISLNAKTHGIKYSLDYLKECYGALRFTKDGDCKSCEVRDKCVWCPGKAFLETGSLEKPIEYCCNLFKHHD